MGNSAFIHVPGFAGPYGKALVAQLDRASDYGSEGSAFESRRVHSLYSYGFAGGSRVAKSAAQGTPRMPSEKSFPIYTKRHASGRVGYRVDLGMVNGKRSFKPFKNEHEAKAFQRKLRTKAAEMNPVMLSDIDSVVRYQTLAQVKRLKEFNATITEAADFYIKHARRARAGRPSHLSTHAGLPRFGEQGIRDRRPHLGIQ